MNTIILAGGYAERLWPLTEKHPKTLLRIAGRPVLYHLLENVARIPDLTRLVIAVDEEKNSFFLEAIDSNDLNIDSQYFTKA